MILGVAFLLMVSLVLGAATAAMGKWWSGAFGSWEVLAQSVNIVLGFAVTTIGFAMIYKLMPRVKVQWRDVWLGAAVTALSVHDRPLPYRALHRQERRYIGLWRGRVADRDLHLGVLLSADISAGCRVHVDLCADFWFEAR